MGSPVKTLLTSHLHKKSPYPWTMEEHSEYQYPVVLDESKQAASFLNIEDMLFEVFRSEDENHIDSIALGQFVVALENTGLRRQHTFYHQLVKQYIFFKIF